MPKRIIAQRLKDAMGLHTPTVGMVTVSSAIDKRMRSLEIDRCEEYLDRLNEDASEMQNLIEAVIIPETWFFRDIIAYEKLLKYLKKNKLTETYNDKSPLRILSIPCSSGEEPYTIAMLLADNGFCDNEYKIDAVDISENLIRHAQQGIYGKNSFRTEDLSFIKRHFTPLDEKFLISERMKSLVNFKNSNLMSSSFLPGHEIYDVIFCRNLLIYFDAPTQAQVFMVLARLLKDDGILILGHAESSQRSAGVFEAAHELGAYINRKTTKKPPLPGARKNITNTDVIKNQSPETLQVEPAQAGPAQNAEINELEDAFVQANNGNIEEAMNLANNYIKRDRFSSRAHYLLGLLYDTAGNTDLADEYLKKSLYLDPNNIETLIHLSLMAEQRGDTEDSERLRNRAARVQSRAKSS